MELRGTRPIVDDPDALLKFYHDTWYGFPDFSTDLQPITESRFQPHGDMVKLLIKSGYPEISNLFDHPQAAIAMGSWRRFAMRPCKRPFHRFPAPEISAFAPSTGPFDKFEGNAIIPLSGDHAPFATSGEKLNGPVGYKVVRVDLSTREVTDFIKNARGGPASALPSGAGLIERPISVKFGTDGKMYIVDLGEVDHKTDVEKVRAGTGKVFVLEPLTPTTRPATTQHSEK